MFNRILVAVDGSDKSEEALGAALDLARRNDGRVRIVHAVHELAFLGGAQYSAAALDSARERATDLLAAAMARAKAAGVQAEQHLIDAPSEGLGRSVAEAATAWDADAIVVGTHGRGGIERALLGSGAEQILRAAPVPVLVIR